MQDSTDKHAKPRKGYLLLEVVMALLLAGLLLGGVMSIATGSLQVSEIIAEDGRRQLTREAFLTFLGRNLEQLPGNAVLDLKLEDAGSHYLSELTFQDVPTSFSWSGQGISAEAVQLTTVLRRSGDLDIVLRYFEKPVLEDSDPEADPSAKPIAEITLLRNMWRFEWWALEGSSLEWDRAWDTLEMRGRLPLQLELNMIFDRNGEEIIHYFWIPTKMDPVTAMRTLTQRAAQSTGTRPANPEVRIGPGGGGGNTVGGGGGNRGGGTTGGNRGGPNPTPRGPPPVPGRQ